MHPQVEKNKNCNEIKVEKTTNTSETLPSETKINSSGRTGKNKLWTWLNSSLKIKMTDERVLIGIFLCTDRDSNVILNSSVEYLNEEDIGVEQPRILGLVMVPGRHIVSIHYEDDIHLNNLLKSY